MFKVRGLSPLKEHTPSFTHFFTVPDPIGTQSTFTFIIWSNVQVLHF